jgi:tetratricopeptide (TPR) repeat protein
MTDNVEVRITPALHPDNVKSIDGFDEQTAPYLAPTMTAFSTAYEGIRAVWAAKEAAATNPTWNEAQCIIQTDDFAQKHFAKISKSFDVTRSNLEKGIAMLEQQLAAPIESKAAASIAGEIRSYAKSLTTEQRHKFIQEAIDGGDEKTVSAICGAPAYLSGLDANFQQTYVRFWNERTAPDLAQRLKAMKGAKQMIEERAGLVFKELEKAVGVAPHKAQALRQAKTNAEKAFVLQDLGQ